MSMIIQTKVVIPDPPSRIGYHTRGMFMGSCFSDYIGTIMAGYKFPLLLNPFGTLFNPASIAANLENLINLRVYKSADLRFHDGLWLSFDHYTGFSDTDQERCLDQINTSVSQASEWLKHCDFLVLTFGTAWIFKYKKTGKTVANCHKIPQAEFSREFMQPAEIVNMFDRLLSLLSEFNPGLRVIFTLSPVRHWSDGAVNNQLSKSVLHYSIQEILKQHGNAWYFPSYEIFMDELRDYRYYAADMLHPSDQGAVYVWEKFFESTIDDKSKAILAELEPVLQAARHRPVNAGSDAHRKFRDKISGKIHEITTKYPFLDFSNEIELFSK
jgi:hypothetical protein